MDIHGLILMDKPEGLTSHDVVAKVRRALKQKRVGHTGTLDPIATGLMIMVLGEATKLSDYLMTEDKAYSVRIRLGVRTDTLDRAGKVLETKPVAVDIATLRAAVNELEGEFEWQVPAFSAAKVDGRKLYELARKDIPVETPSKEMKFWDVELKTFAGDLANVDMRCSKGSFVRTWVERLGDKLGTGAMVEELRRTAVGRWTLAQAVSLPTLEEIGSAGQLGASLITLNEALPFLRPMVVDERESRLIGNGQIPRGLAGRLIPEQKQAFDTGQATFVKVVSGAGQLLAILGAEPGQGLKIRRVFRLTP